MSGASSRRRRPPGHRGGHAVPRGIGDQIEIAALADDARQRLTRDGLAGGKNGRLDAIDGHWYSTPYRLIRELVNARIAENTVEIFHKDQRIAIHARAPNRRGHTTIADHMPRAHRRYGKWTSGGLIAAGEKIGSSTAVFCFETAPLEKDGKMSKITGKTETIENVEFPTFDPSKATEQVRAVAERGVYQIGFGRRNGSKGF
ncbi:hypothetical protein GCM10010869_59230 [Mesorhizobium tianshanense]|uniref:Transposase for insertion sequence element IS21-like C-terminal domain-containing protein n=1 Tax=Mesorhizobium tianshanense TaxID=39844 RepID=A0A562N3R7_9HYPH|nr:hypothetical protein IQ26_05795 [Mesorhizobium tianshanense]GLS40326.1 hypothetical protein GCM10010869_59230 [Mesorhizobium tianshanense]